MLTNVVNTALTTGATVLLLDTVYLTVFQKMFYEQIRRVQRAPIEFKFLYVVLCYVTLIAGLLYFVILPRKSVWDAFLLGLLVYGVYETTNMAILKEWTLGLVALDTLWGGVLMATTTWVVYSIFPSKGK